MIHAHRKKTISILLTLALLAALLPTMALPAAADDAAPATEWSDENYRDTTWGSDYESATAFTVSDVNDFAQFAALVNSGKNFAGKTVTLAANLNLGAHKWTPIGDLYNPFVGTFDGGGHSISGLYVSGSYNNAGLFGFVSGGTVQNLTVRGSVTVTGTGTEVIYAGGVAGQLANWDGKSTVQNCRSEVTVEATVESNSNNNIACSGGIVGRIAGDNNQGNITVLNCYHSGNLSATTTCTSYPVANVGGVVANLQQNGTVQNCYHTGAVTATVKGTYGTNYAGGVAGNISLGTVQNCYSIGAISASGAPNEYTYTGGVAGHTNSGNTVTGNYYRSGTATYGIGKLGDGNPSDVGASPLTAEQFKTQSNFKTGTGNETWDFTNTWIMDANRPRLRSNIGTADDPFLASSWSQLYDALQLGGYVKLAADVTCTEDDITNNKASLTVPTGVTAALDLNGHVIRQTAVNVHVLEVNGGTLTLTDSAPDTPHFLTLENWRCTAVGDAGTETFDPATGSGVLAVTGGCVTGAWFNTNPSGDGGSGVFISAGALVMDGGSIVGNYTEIMYGGGVYIWGGAAFTMNGGAIRCNCARGGGGVSVSATAAFTMNGGELSGNVASAMGGGVFISSGGAFTMNGGTICGNRGGGVFVCTGITTTFTISDGPVITGNHKGTDTTAADYNSNVELVYGKTITVAGPLTGAASVGVTLAQTYGDNAFTSGLSGNGDAAYFVSDDAKYHVELNEGGEAFLSDLYTVTWKNGDYVLGEDTVAYGDMPVYTGETPMKAADAQYTYAFAGWTPEIYAVTADATYTAVYTATPKPAETGGWVASAPAFSQTFETPVDFDGGTVAVSPEKAKEGDPVTLTATPKEGYKLWSLTAGRADGKPLMLTSDALGAASFTMPGCEVTVNAVFAALDGPMPPVVLSPQKITVNGVEATVEAYNIGGTNFFRLRDLAALLKGTPAQFNVDYDEEANAVVVKKGVPYDGGVRTDYTDNSASAVASPQTVYVDGAAVELTAFNIGGYNFFGLRELAAFFGYAVGYDAATNTAIIESR